MIKRLLLLLALMLPCAAASVHAQFGVGDWKMHSVFSGQKAQNIIDTGDKVYYLVSNNLFCYDKQTQENEALNRRNYLNDAIISQIYYNSYKKYLMVVYDDCNIDVITASGKVVNMPDVKDALMTTDKTINDVSFTADVAYVATKFGYLVINDKKFEVKESHIYNQSIASVAVVGNQLMLSSGSYLYYGDVNGSYDRIDYFRSIQFDANGKIFPVGDNRFLFTTGYLTMYNFSFDEKGGIQLTGNLIAEAAPTSVQRTPSGIIANFGPSKDFYYTFDANGDNATQVRNPSKDIMSSATEGKWWALGSNGLHLIDNGVSGEYFKPSGLSMNIPFYMTFNKLDNKLYVSSTGTNHFFSDQYIPMAINTYDGSTWTDVTPTGNWTSLAPGRNSTSNGTGTYWVTPDPDDASTYYMGSWWFGVLKVQGGTIANAYNWTNSPMENNSQYYCHSIPAIDRAGTLWVVHAGSYQIMALPKSKRMAESVTKSDWITPSIANIQSNKRGRLLAMSKTDDKIYSCGDYQKPIVFFNDGGNPSSSIKSASYSQFTDQDGKTFQWGYVTSLVEDLNGKVWMGSTEGVVSFDPKDAYSQNFRINHIKVPRNDGTNLADYLLDGIQVNSIAVDGSNRKWIGTNSSGLFLVSADGSEIIKQFTTSNSYLTSNTIYGVCCNPNNNSVYVITDNGFFEYFSDSTPAESDYSSVYAYPNPVRPDFTGLITIKGLMDNSLVKITDPAGNVVKQLKSNGGMATWDGCNESGARVKTGVYFVFASQSETEGSNSAVTKIMVIR